VFEIEFEREETLDHSRCVADEIKVLFEREFETRVNHVDARNFVLWLKPPVKNRQHLVENLRLEKNAGSQAVDPEE